MALTKVTIHDLSRLIQNKLARARVKTLLDALANAVDAGTQVAGSVTTAMLAAGVIAATSTGRALFGAGVFDLTTVTSAFAANSIPASKLVTVAAPGVLSGAGAIDITKIQTNFTSTGAGQALTLANGTFAGQRVVVFHSVDGGSGVITPTTFDHTSVTLTNVYDSVEFVWTGATWTLGRLIGATVQG